MDPLRQALAALADGQVVLLYDADGREEETDMVVASNHCTPQVIARMRRDAGGLICTAIAADVHSGLGLPYLSDLIHEAARQHPALGGLVPDDIQYDGSKPAFGLTLNHRDTFTGVTDEDRSRTITRLAALAHDLPRIGSKKAQKRLGKEFRAPGHVLLLNGHPLGLAARQGHTELSLAMARLAGLPGSTTVCEMMGDGKALGRAEAEAYAQEHGLVFLTGKHVIDAWHRQQATSVPTSA